MTERNTRIRASQIRSVLPNDLEATNAIGSGLDNYIPSYDVSSGKFTWIEQSAGGSSNASYSTTFTDASLSSAGVLLVNHSLSEKLVQVAVYNNDYDYIVPDDITLTDDDNLNVDLSSHEPLTGTWTVVVIASGGLNTKIEDNDGDTSIEVERTSDIDKIYFKVGGSDQLILEDGILRPLVDEDIDLGSATYKFGTGYFASSSLYLGTNKLSISNSKLQLNNVNVGDVTLDRMKKAEDNIMLNAFRLQIQNSLTIQNMIDGFSDEYEDETGIDNVNSINESYVPGGYYTNARDLAGVDSYTKLMIHANGSNGDTTTSDSSASNHTITFNGNAKLSTTQKQFGTTALSFSQGTDYISIANHADFQIATSQDFTVDCWVRWNQILNDKFIFGTHHAGPGFGMGYQAGYLKTWGAFTMSALFTPTANTWYHIALDRYNGVLKIFVGGVSKGSLSTTASSITTNPLWIGQDPGSVVTAIDGYIDEFRWSKGISRYQGSNFSVPTSEYSSSATIYNMTLISNTQTAEAVPTEGRIVILEEDVDTITLNTDLLAYSSRDGGSTWVQGTLSDVGSYDSTKQILVADFDFTASGIGSGTNMEYKLVTANEKDLQIHATAPSWN